MIDPIAHPDAVRTHGNPHRGWTRRAALGAISAAAAGFMLLGPRGRDSIPAGRTVLDYWEKWTGHEGLAMQALVDRFNASQERLWVRYLPVASIDQKAQVAIAGSAPPDLLGLWNYNVPGYAEAGAILPLNGLQSALPAESKLRLENYAAGIRPIMTHTWGRGGGSSASGAAHVWGVVSTGGCIALYYNRALLRDAPGGPIAPPRTISEFDRACDRLHVVEGKGRAARIKRMGFHHREPGWWSYLWGYAFGGSLYDAATDRATTASPGNLAGYSWVRSFPERFGADAVNAFRSTFGKYDTAQNAFLTGQLAFVVQGPWLANIINRYAPELDYGVVPVPVADAIYDPAEHDEHPIGLVDTDILVIPRGARRPEASMEFIAFTQRPENVEFLANAHFKGSTLATVSPAFEDRHPNRGIAVFNRITRSRNAYRCPKTRTWPELKDQMDQAVDAIWNLNGEAGAILGAVERRSQQILDRAARAAARRRGEAGAEGTV